MIYFDQTVHTYTFLHCLDTGMQNVFWSSQISIIWNVHISWNFAELYQCPCCKHPKIQTQVSLAKFNRLCVCSMFCCTLLYVHSSIAIILMGKRELIALLNLSSWCLVMVGRLFLAVPRGCLQFVIVVFPDHTHLLFFIK